MLRQTESFPVLKTPEYGYKWQMPDEVFTLKFLNVMQAFINVMQAIRHSILVLGGQSMFLGVPGGEVAITALAGAGGLGGWHSCGNNYSGVRLRCDRLSWHYFA